MSHRDKVQRHAPILKFARGEQFFPMQVDAYIDKCSLHLCEGDDLQQMIIPPGYLTLADLHRWQSPDHFLVYADYQKYVDPQEVAEFTPQVVDQIVEGTISHIKKLANRFLNGRLPGYVRGQALANYGDLAQNPPAYYYHVVPKSVSGEPYDVIQYWYFYAYNDWATTYGGTNDHEADWECIQLFFDSFEDDTPRYVGFSAHEHFYVRMWDEVDKGAAGKRPIAYIGAGSHASYPEHDGWRWYRFVLNWVADPLNFFKHLKNFLSAEYWRAGDVTIDTWDAAINLDGLDWVSDYKGQWGARYYIRPRITRSLRRKSGDAPAGPMYEIGGDVREKWSHPAHWHKLI